MKACRVEIVFCCSHTLLLLALFGPRRPCFGFTDRLGSQFIRRFDAHRRVTKRTRTLTVRLTESVVDDYEEWDAGDVYQDFSRLEQAIAFSNADQRLQHKERIETMDYFSQRRRPLRDDIKRLVLIPTALSFFLVVAFKSIRQSPGIWKVLDVGSSAHFWLLTVCMPSLTCLRKVQTKRQATTDTRDELPSQLRNIAEYDRYLSRLDPQSSAANTHDHITLFLEQWMSAVAGMAIVSHLIPASLHGASVALRALTRLAVFASWHQKQQLWFQLHRSQQPRPLAASVHIIQTLVSWQWWKWMLALDASLAVSKLPWPVAIWAFALWTTVPALLAVCPAWITSRPWHKVPFRRYGAAASLALVWRILESRDAFASGWALHDLKMSQLYLPFLCNRRALCTGLVIAAALVGPVCHMVAVLRLIHISHTHDVSLALQVEEFHEQIKQEGRTKWRYRLHWRDPKPMRETFEGWRRGFWHWFLFSGSVDEKTRQKMQNQRRREVGERDVLIWQRLARESERDPDAPMSNRTDWKPQAMARLSAKFERDYEEGNFEDPLGIVVHQTFGIGLGFNFDHMSKLEPSEKPSIRRLQARAAKSAVRRARQIYDAESARTILDKIDDPHKRDLKAVELRQAADKEMKDIARRLTELLPTELSTEKGTTRVQQFQASRSFVKTSKNEYVVSSPLEESQAIEKLRRASNNHSTPDEVDYMNPSSSPKGAKDDEFIEAWATQENDAGIGPNDDDDDPPEARLT